MKLVSGKSIETGHPNIFETGRFCFIINQQNYSVIYEYSNLQVV